MAESRPLRTKEDPGRAEAGRLDCFATDTSRLDELAPRFLGEPLTGFELVDL